MKLIDILKLQTQNHELRYKNYQLHFLRHGNITVGHNCYLCINTVLLKWTEISVCIQTVMPTMIDQTE